MNCEVHVRAVVSGILQLESDLATLPPGSPDKQLTHYILAQLYSFQGVPRQALQHFQMAYDIHPTITLSGQEIGLEKSTRNRRIAAWRNGKLCISSQRGYVYRAALQQRLPPTTSGSENAVKHLLRFSIATLKTWKRSGFSTSLK